MPITFGRASLLSALTLAFAGWAFNPSASAQVTSTIGKQHRTVQSDATTLNGDSSLGGAWRFSASVDASATGTKTFTVPGGQPQTLTADGSVFDFVQYFSSQSALNAAFPGGTYTLSYNGKNVALQLTGDPYPSQPLVTASNGTWSLGTLYVTPGQAVTLTYLFGANYAAGESRMSARVTGATYSDIETASDFSHSQWSITIPASALTSGSAFSVILDSDLIPTADTTTVPGFTTASYFEAETSLIVQAGSAPISGQPRFLSAPSSVTVATGSTVTLYAPATGSPAPTYQWMFGKVAVAGATGPRLVISNATAAQAGSYSCVASNVVGSSNSGPATITVVATTNPGRLINLSVIGQVQGTLTTGFVIGGAGTSGSETVLLRGIGPALSGFGLSGLMTDPTIALFPAGTSTPSASNSGWGATTANVTAVNTADSATGAFALSNPASFDSAMVQTLTAGGYSLQISGRSGDSGVALTEVYDDTSNYVPANARLINVSCLTPVAAGGTLTAGFVIGGSAGKTVLIRASGPALKPLGVPGVMADPEVAVFASGSSTALAQNAGWGGDAQINAAATAVNAFAFPNASSADSAVLLTLMPGGYSAQLTSVSGGSGTALVEVYEVPE